MAEDASRPQAQVRQEFEQSFEQMYANPTDVAATLRYSRLATELGDYESAIPPLERLLMYNPKLSKVRLEVGVLYYQLKSHTMARTYLTQVQKDAAADPALKQRAEAYLAKL